MQSMVCELDNAVKKHDIAIANSAIDIWIGAEPTFTLCPSEEPQWLSQALGGDKQAYALRMASALCRQHPGSILLRTVGRQYGEEKLPRWSFGLFERRDNTPVWSGPPDPALLVEASGEATRLDSFVIELEQAIVKQHWSCKHVALQTASEETRLLVRLDAGGLDDLDESDPRLARSSIHSQKTPDSGLLDPLAEQGYFLFTISQAQTSESVSSICVELPAFKQVNEFLDCLSLLSMAATAAKLPQLMLQGYPPPVDHTVAWTTITPDPAVIEVNLAPQPDISHFFAANRELFAIADELGLSPYRLHYNGRISDSGGGGQFTLGGKTAESSPFFVEPALLPRLIRYFNLHPSLSYLFATNYVGSASQSPRVDENTRDSFHELAITLEQLECHSSVTPEFLHASLAPFLADASGNSHRSELNIEKLWNPQLPLRGCLGLLEFRAFRMPYTPQRSVAIALLLRSVTAMLANNNLVGKLHDWGDELHDRFALPLFLYQDLKKVFTDLEHTGYGLEPCIQDELLTDPYQSAWSTSFSGCHLSIEQAIEFWPLVGDVASQESGGSRLVDSSTLRLQISLQQENPDSPALSGWQLQTADYTLPMRHVENNGSEVRVIGLRYRDFIPWRGLHPGIKPTNPIILYLFHPAVDTAVEVALHNWRFDKMPYNGLPQHLQEAAQRRAERFVVKTIPQSNIPKATAVPDTAIHGFTFDYRRV